VAGATGPTDRWPAVEVSEPDGTAHFSLKDGAEIQGAEPPPEICDNNDAYGCCTKGPKPGKLSGERSSQKS